LRLPCAAAPAPVNPRRTRHGRDCEDVWDPSTSPPLNIFMSFSRVPGLLDEVLQAGQIFGILKVVPGNQTFPQRWHLRSWIISIGSAYACAGWRSLRSSSLIPETGSILAAANHRRSPANSAGARFCCVLLNFCFAVRSTTDHVFSSFALGGGCKNFPARKYFARFSVTIHSGNVQRSLQFIVSPIQ